MLRLDSVTGTPQPRDDSVAHRAMARATCTVVMTMRGVRQFGSRWRNRMRVEDAPIAIAASIYSLRLSICALARTVRA